MPIITLAILFGNNSNIENQIHSVYSVSNRDFADTLKYSNTWDDTILQVPGEAILVVYQMPADGYIKGVNVPIKEWGTGDQQMTFAIYELTYPYGLDDNGDPISYPQTSVNALGWIGGYDVMVDSGAMVFDGDVYSSPGDAPVCAGGANPVADYAADPLGQVDSPFGPPGLPLQGLIWPDGFTAPTLDPANNPDNGDVVTPNWINTADFGTEPTVAGGTWVGVLVFYSGAGGGTDEATSFHSTEGSPLGLSNPWRSLKFYAGCSGISGSGGWHIIDDVVNFELAVLFTQDYPVVYPPNSLTVTQTGLNDVRLNWSTISDSDIVQYNVYSRNDLTDYSIVGSVTGNPPETIFAAQDLSHGMQHYFRVTAVNSYGIESSPSNIVSIYIPEPIFSVDVGEADAFPAESVSIPIFVEFPVDSSFSSMEISLGGFQGLMTFTGIDTQNSMIGNINWTLAVNETDSLLITAWAGSEEISGEGVLFWLDFIIPDTAQGFIPIVIDHIMFDEADLLIEVLSGGVNVFQLIPGDVSLDGEVHAYDASLILKYLVGLEDLNHYQLINANATMDTTISALDASMILQYVVALLDSLPHDTINGLFSASGDVTMSDHNIIPGQPIVIPIYLTNGNNIYSFEADFVYNSEHLTFNEILWPQAISEFSIETNEADNLIHIAGASTSPDGQQGVFLTLVYTVNDDFSNTETNVLFQRLRWNEEPIVENAAASVLTTSLNTGENLSIPQDFALHQNFPNPFNPITTIHYVLPKQSNIQITIYDLKGGEVITLVSGDQDAGYKSVQWNAANMPSGTYFYKIKAGDFVQTRKMILLK